MKDKPTNELDELLKNTKPDDMASYLTENKSYMADEKKAFSYYFKNVIEEKGIKYKDLYMAADVSESYGSKIISMEKHAKDRDLIIRLCLAGHFSWDEMNRALKLYGMTELYSKDPRDACIIVAVNNRMFDPYQVNEILKKQGLKSLTKDE